MNIFSIFKRQTGPIELDLNTRSAERKKYAARALAKSMAGRRTRLTTDAAYESSMFASFDYIESPESSLEKWRRQNLNDQTLSRLSAADLVELMADVSPEISRALWDFLRFCNPGWKIKAMVSENESPAGKAAIDKMISGLEDLYGSFDVVINRLFIGGFLRGAFLGEVVLDQKGREFLDFATPDPYSVRFKKVNDPDRGTVWQMGQWQSGSWVSLEVPTVGYVPIDPLPGKPYGRSMVGSAIFAALFLIGMLHDIRRVVAQQGYPRLDLSIDLEKLIEAMPDSIEDDPTEFKNWVNGVVDEVCDEYGDLEPDDAYVHTDVVSVNRPVGAIHTDSLGAVDGLIRSLERMATRALKTMPLLMASNEAVSETHANRQWEIHVAGIKSIQHLCENLLARLFTVALHAQGIQADVEFKFSELRASEELRDAQTEAILILNETAKYNQGWTSQNEGAQQITGHDADVPGPRMSPTLVDIYQGDGEGEEPIRQLLAKSGVEYYRAVQIVPEGSEVPLPLLPDEVIIGDREIDAAIELWDELIPRLYRGMLDAEVVGQTDYGENGRGKRAGGKPVWEWRQATKRYHHNPTNQFIGQRRMVELRDEFAERQKERVADSELNDQLLTGDISIQRWVLGQREIIKQTYIDQYVMGKGGRNAMTQADWGRVGRMLRDQYGYLQNFGQDIADGKKSVAQIRNQASMYIDSSVQAFERGKAASYGNFTLPAHPGDGQTKCLGRCRCKWRIKETDEAWECTWVIDSAAENCEDCQGNARKWNPLIIEKTRARTRQQLAEVLNNV